MATFRTADGLSLHYLDEGDVGRPAQPPLLCLPGLTRSGADFDHFAAALAGTDQARRIVRLDSRGRGGSDHDPDFANYNVTVEAGDALALMDHLGIERAVVVGSSRGGLLAMVIAATAPARLAGVVLNDVGAAIEAGGIARIVGYLGVAPAAKTMAAAAEDLEQAFGAEFPGVGADFWRDWAVRSYRETAEGLALTYDLRLRDATLAQAKEIDPDGPGLWPLYEALGPIPTLVLRGENSALLSAETVARMKSGKPDLLTETVANRGHIPRLDEPEAMAAICAFLKDRT